MELKFKKTINPIKVLKYLIFNMVLLFSSEDFEDEKSIDNITSTLSREILSGNYDNVIINCGNFLLWEKDWEVFPLIPEMYEDKSWSVLDQEKWNMCFKDWTLYNTRFSLKSLEMWLNTLLDAKSSTLSKWIQIIPLLSIDDKYVDRDLANKYLLQWYKSIPEKYRHTFEGAFDGVKNTKSILKIVPSILKDSWQKVRNEFILSENELVSRFHKIRKEHIKGQKVEYKNYQESLPDKTRKCSLELFHLLKTLVNEKDRIDEWWDKKLCIMQFVPDACEWSAMASAKSIVKDREDIDIISIVPTMTWADTFIITKFNDSGQKIINKI